MAGKSARIVILILLLAVATLFVIAVPVQGTTISDGTYAGIPYHQSISCQIAHAGFTYSYYGWHDSCTPILPYPPTTIDEVTANSTYTTTYSMYSTYVNINLSDYCPQVSAGGFEFRLVSDSTGLPANPDSMSAVDRLTCNGENQVADINEFSYVGGGWIVPVFPSEAMYGGGLNITVAYNGEKENFAGAIPPIGTDCVTLHVPSGNVSSSTVMNGSSSHCA